MDELCSLRSSREGREHRCEGSYWVSHLSTGYHHNLLKKTLMEYTLLQFTLKKIPLTIHNLRYSSLSPLLNVPPSKEIPVNLNPYTYRSRSDTDYSRVSAFIHRREDIAGAEGGDDCRACYYVLIYYARRHYLAHCVGSSFLQRRNIKDGSKLRSLR